MNFITHRYCKKQTILIKCIKDFAYAVEPCLGEKEKEGKTMLVNIATNLLEFLCQNDGHRIASFFEKRGRECISNRLMTLGHCGSLWDIIPSDRQTDDDDVPQLIITEIKYE